MRRKLKYRRKGRKKNLLEPLLLGEVYLHKTINIIRKYITQKRITGAQDATRLKPYPDVGVVMVTCSDVPWTRSISDPCRCLCSGGIVEMWKGEGDVEGEEFMIY